MSMDSFRNPGAVLMNTKSSLSSSVPAASPATACALPFSSSASPAGCSNAAPLLDSPFAGAERHRMSSSAFGGGADAHSSAFSLRRSSWSSSSPESFSDGSSPPSRTMSHLENTLVAALFRSSPCSSSSAPSPSSSSSVDESAAPWRDPNPRQRALWRRLRRTPPRNGSASLLIPTASSQPTFFRRPCIRSISSTTVIQLLPFSRCCFLVAAFLGRPTLICPAHVTLGDCGSSSSSSSARRFALLDPRNMGLDRGPGAWARRRSMVARDGLQMGLGISARRCRAGKQTSRSVVVATPLPPPPLPPIATVVAFLMATSRQRQAATACNAPELEEL
ncbi:hypothetical protein QOZ80_6AG0533570 [Eleusine coracana subsp. coracana]|nr:hypothetical protein QOZ80_6AG0533570 [Eleusine coracana subsp. coracana]